jgi:hypothetical protein
MIWKWFPLFFCLIVGGWLRFTNLNWDDGLWFNPDEYKFTTAAREVSFFRQFDPNLQAYGIGPIYMTRAIGDTLRLITGDQKWTTDAPHVTVIGRTLAAIASCMTIFFVYLIGLSLSSLLTASMAAWLVATSPLLVQYAHFHVPESLLTMWGVIILFISLQLFHKKNVWFCAGLGMLLGAAIATKITAASLFVIPLMALLGSHRWGKTSLKKPLGYALYIGLSSMVTYLGISAITVINWQGFLDSFTFESTVATGAQPIFYTFQFLHTLPYLYHFRQFPTTMGIVPTILVVVGFLYVTIKAWRHRHHTLLLLTIWPLLYMAYTGMWYAKFVRYFLPVYPFLYLTAALGVTDLIRRMGHRRRWLNVILILTLVIGSALPGFAFRAIYTRPQTRIAAYDWIMQHVPAGSVITTDDFSEVLPDMDPPNEAYPYTVRSIPILMEDNQDKLAALVYYLATSDVFIVGTRRQSGVALSHPTEFPRLSAFYRNLFSGSLGYTPIATFTSYPTLTIGKHHIPFPDEAVEETFQVFDHPTVKIFQNTQRLSIEQLITILENQ